MIDWIAEEVEREEQECGVNPWDKKFSEGKNIFSRKANRAQV